MKNKIFNLVFGLLIPAVILAHPPSKVVVTYDKDAKKLHIVADHGVKDAGVHYINKLIITVDGKVVNTLEYTSQTDLQKQDIVLDMPDLKAGQEIEVKATCNKMGAKSGKIKI